MLAFSVVVLKTELTKGSGFIRGTECNIYLIYNTETNVIFRSEHFIHIIGLHQICHIQHWTLSCA